MCMHVGQMRGLTPFTSADEAPVVLNLSMALFVSYFSVTLVRILQDQNVEREQ